MTKISIPGILTLLIFITTVKLYFFYQYFGINIFLFLEADEIILKSIYFLPYIIPLLLLCLIIYKKSPKSEWQKKKFPTLFKFERVVLFSLIYGFFIISLVLIGSYFQKKEIPNYETVIDVIIHYFILTIIILFVYTLYLFLRNDDQKNNFYSIILSKKASQIFSLTIVLTLIMCYFSITEIIRVKENILFKNAEIHTDKETIKCNREITCIGFSKNYVYLYDTKNKQPIIYNLNTVKLIKTEFSLNTY